MTTTPIFPKTFDFAWATCPLSKWKTVNFYHNAGVVSPNHRMFYKGMYMDKLPYDDNVDIDPIRSFITLIIIEIPNII